jgi:hypothetical protein
MNREIKFRGIRRREVMKEQTKLHILIVAVTLIIGFFFGYGVGSTPKEIYSREPEMTLHEDYERWERERWARIYVEYLDSAEAFWAKDNNSMYRYTYSSDQLSLYLKRQLERRGK